MVNRKFSRQYPNRMVIILISNFIPAGRTTRRIPYRREALSAFGRDGFTRVIILPHDKSTVTQ